MKLKNLGAILTAALIALAVDMSPRALTAKSKPSS